MANPTTNYGFVLPTSTDLVTDLPADFDVALQGVDTRLKALQPGTTLGDLAYSSATANTNTRLALGTAGQVLTVNSGATAPQWSTPAGGGDVTLITTNSFTTQTSISIDNCFTSTYQNYLVEITGTSSTSSQIKLRLRKSSADLSATSYDFRGTASQGNANGWILTSGGISAFSSQITFFNPVSSGYKTIIANAVGLSTGALFDALAGGGIYDVNTSGADGLSLFATSGTLTGTIRVYGLKN